MKGRRQSIQKHLCTYKHLQLFIEAFQQIQTHKLGIHWPNAGGSGGGGGGGDCVSLCSCS